MITRETERPIELVFLSLFSIVILLTSACSQASGTVRQSPPTPTVSTQDPQPPAAVVPTATATVVSVTNDIVYATSLGPGPSTSSEWKMDVYSPRAAGAWPIAVLIHGLGGSKEGYIGPSETIARKGAVVYVPNYPDMVVDMAARDKGRGYRELSETLLCAIHFAKSTASQYGGDPATVTLIGHSYGTLYGIWSALASEVLPSRWDEYAGTHDEPTPRVACERISDSATVDAYIGVAGGRYQNAEVLKERDPDLWEIVSPFTYFGRRMEMPIALIVGDRDRVTVRQSSEEFNETLLKAGYDSRLITFDGLHQVPGEVTFEAMMELISK